MKSIVLFHILLIFFLRQSIDVKACTLFNSSANSILHGNNEEYNEAGYMFILPSNGDSYGKISRGFSNGWSQGSVNEKGLGFDWATTGATAWSIDPSKGNYEGELIRGYYQLNEYILSTCATIEDVINASHPMFMDSSGASVVIEWGDTKLTTHIKEEDFQVLTNFSLTNLSIGWYPCWRYQLAETVLERKPEHTVELFKEILENVHQEGDIYTVYSNIYDISNGIISCPVRHLTQNATYCWKIVPITQNDFHTESIVQYFRTPEM